MPEPTLRVIALGGLGEVGKNMTVLEHGEELVVVDAGLAFPRDEHLGVDLILPDPGCCALESAPIGPTEGGLEVDVSDEALAEETLADLEVAHAQLTIVIGYSQRHDSPT